MEISFNTHNAEATVALKALQLYKSKQYKEAIIVFTDILDIEPSNWEARLLLGACHFKLQQYMAAQRIFQYISQSCNNNIVRAKALEAMRAIDSQLNAQKCEIPPEFGCYAPPPVVRSSANSWMDFS